MKPRSLISPHKLYVKICLEVRKQWEGMLQTKCCNAEILEPISCHDVPSFAS